MCRKPYREGVAEYGCGQCMPCRLNRRRMWTARIVLEAALHESSFFFTLTYSPEHYPCDGSLIPKHLQDWLKRLRARCAPERVRFFGVGEYGDKGGRAHYHAVVFGLSDHSHGVAAWPFGLVHVGLVTHNSAAYIAGYVVKKWTKVNDPRLRGRHPEFCRMSLRPGGIGAAAVPLLALSVNRDASMAKLARVGDVPHEFRLDGRLLPIGRYLRGLFREAVGWSKEMPEGTRARVLRTLQAELREPGARARREARREYVYQSAQAKARIGRSNRRF